MSTENRFVKDKDKSFDGKESDNCLFATSTADQILRLPESEFLRLVSIRLNTPIYEANRKGHGLENREVWSGNYLIEEIFTRIATIREIVTHNSNQIRIYKYYNQALCLAKWIPIAKPQVEFVINTSDLTVRILAELKVLDPQASQQVLKLNVAQIFENIVGSKNTHRSIIRNLKVRWINELEF